MQILLAVGFVIAGLFLIFFKDMAWEIQERNNLRKGITNSERTEAWERTMTISGVFVVGFGILLLLVRPSG